MTVGVDDAADGERHRPARRTAPPTTAVTGRAIFRPQRLEIRDFNDLQEPTLKFLAQERQAVGHSLGRLQPIQIWISGAGRLFSLRHELDFPVMFAE
jgi:hypothetical protein